MTDQRRVYSESVWSNFQDKAATPSTRMMSSAEWALLASWMDRGIPLRVVLRGIKDCGGKPGTLLGVRAAVEEAYVQWRKAMA